MLKKYVLNMFFPCICYAVFFYSNTAFGIDWEQWRIPDEEQNDTEQYNPGQDNRRYEQERQREINRKAEAFKLNEKGNQAYGIGNWKEAIDYYQKALKKSPYDPVIRKNLTSAKNALAEQDNRMRDENLRKRETDARLKEENARKREALKLNEKGNQAYRTENWKEAIDYYRKALKKSPYDSVIRQNLTNALAEEDNRIREDNIIKREKEDRQREVVKLKEKGNQAYSAGNWKAAIDYYKKVLKESPNDSVIRQNLTNAKNALVEEDARRQAQLAQAVFEKDKKEILARFKGGSGRGNLSLKGSGRTPVLKQGNTQTDKAIKDLHNSVYWSLKAASAISNNNYEAASEFANFAEQEFPGGDIQLPSVPDAPAPVRADPQVELYTYIIREANHTTSELKKINTRLEQAKEKKSELSAIIIKQKTIIEELEQKTPDPEEKKEQELKPEVTPPDEKDKLMEEAMAALAEAQKLDEKADDMIDMLTSQEKEQEGNLEKLKQGFDAVEKHPEQAGKLLKKLKGDKQ